MVIAHSAIQILGFVILMAAIVGLLILMAVAFIQDAVIPLGYVLAVGPFRREHDGVRFFYGVVGVVLLIIGVSVPLDLLTILGILLVGGMIALQVKLTRR